MKKFISCLLIAILLISSTAAYAAGQSSFKVFGYELSDTSLDILLYANTDSYISEKDFSVKLGDVEIVPESLSAYSSGEYATSWILIVEPNSHSSVQTAVKAFTETLLLGMREADNVAVYCDAKSVQNEFLSTKDTTMQLVESSLKEEGKVHLYDTINAALNTLKTSTDLNDHRCLVILTEGNDYGSIYTIDEITKDADGLPITVYTIGLTRGSSSLKDRYKEISVLSRGNGIGFSKALDDVSEGASRAAAQAIRDNENKLFVLSSLFKTMPEIKKSDLPLSVSLNTGNKKLDSTIEKVDGKAINKELRKFDVTVNYASSVGGYVSTNKETLAPAAGVARGSTAKSLAGYHFVNWTDASGKEVSNTPSFIPEKVSGLNISATYTANFAEDDDITITYVATTGGSVSEESETLAPATGIAAGSTAAASAGYHFINWTNSAGDTVCDTETFVPEKINGINFDETYKANFAEDDNITITYVATTGGSVSIGNETLAPVTGIASGATATASDGYHFVNWTDADGREVSNTSTFIPSKVSDLNVEAKYIANFAEGSSGTGVFGINNSSFTQLIEKWPIHDSTINIMLAVLFAAIIVLIIVLLARKSRKKRKDKVATMPVKPSENVRTQSVKSGATITLTNVKTGKTATGELNSNKEVLRAGRIADLKLEGDPGISKVHMDFIWSNGIMYIQDAKSLNGTRVNGTLIGKAVPINQSDVIHVGDSDFRVNWVTH